VPAWGEVGLRDGAAHPGHQSVEQVLPLLSHGDQIGLEGGEAFRPEQCTEAAVFLPTGLPSQLFKCLKTLVPLHAYK